MLFGAEAVDIDAPAPSAAECKLGVMDPFLDR